MERLQELNESLIELKKDFNTQINAMESNKVEFDDVLIELSAKYPEHRELLSFIVHVNDKLETNQTIFVDIVSDTLNEIIKNKNILIKKIISDKKLNIEKDRNKDTKSVWERTKVTITFFKNFKIIITSLSIIAIAIAVIVAPHAFLAVIKALTSLL